MPLRPIPEPGRAIKTTAFVSHYDCSRHDTGWNHPEHQGRLPGLMRMVYRDMPALLEPLLEIEGRHATEEELRLVHSAAYLDRLRSWVAEAAETGRPQEVEPGIVVSDATWDGAAAAVGSVLTAVDAVLDGRVSNAFCAVRPPGSGAKVGGPGGFSLLNSVAIAARALLRRGVGRVALLDWDARGESALAGIVEGDAAIDYAVVPPAAGESRAAFLAAQEEALATLSARPCDFLLVSAGFDFLAADPVTDHALEPGDFHAATERLREWAEERCGGRMVTVLEGGFDPPAVGAATVQHLRALAQLPPAD